MICLSLPLFLTCTHTPFKQEIGCFLFTRKWLLWTWHIWKSIHLITSHYCADPPLVLPTLVDLIYSTQESVQISASTTLVALLVNHKQKPEVLCLLLDCLRYFDKWSFSFFIYLFGNLRFKEFLQSRICICNLTILILSCSATLKTQIQVLLSVEKKVWPEAYFQHVGLIFVGVHHYCFIRWPLVR